MPHTAQEPVAPRQQESAPRSQPAQQRAAPRIDDDMGIVRMEQPKPSQQAARKTNDSPPHNAPNPMIPRQQVQLKAREERDQAGGPLTSGQKRAAAELDRIRREQNRTSEPTPEEKASVSSRQTSANTSRRPSNTSTVTTEGDPGSLEETLERMKTVLRQHERRIRILEEFIAESNVSFYLLKSKKYRIFRWHTHTIFNKKKCPYLDA
jgi:hypothetical protein